MPDPQTTKQVWKRNIFGRWKRIRETSDFLWLLKNQHRYVYVGNGLHAPGGMLNDFMRKVKL